MGRVNDERWLVPPQVMQVLRENAPRARFVSDPDLTVHAGRDCPKQRRGRAQQLSADDVLDLAERGRLDACDCPVSIVSTDTRTWLEAAVTTSVHVPDPGQRRDVNPLSGRDQVTIDWLVADPNEPEGLCCWPDYGFSHLCAPWLPQLQLALREHRHAWVDARARQHPERTHLLVTSLTTLVNAADACVAELAWEHAWAGVSDAAVAAIALFALPLPLAQRLAGPHPELVLERTARDADAWRVAKAYLESAFSACELDEDALRLEAEQLASFPQLWATAHAAAA